MQAVKIYQYSGEIESVHEFALELSEERKCSYTEALEAVRVERPEIWRSYLDRGGETSRVEITEIAGRPGLRVYVDGSLLNVSRPLGETLMRYAPEGFVGDYLYPVVPVAERVGTIPLFGQGDARLVNVDRAPGVEGNVAPFSTSSVQAICRGRSLRLPVPIELELNTDNGWQLRESTTLHLANLQYIAKDARVAASINTPTNTSSIFGPSSAWNSGGNAFGNIETLINHVSSFGGVRPDRVCFGAEAWASFASNSSTLARCGGWITPQRAAEALRLESVAIAEARYNVGAGSERKFVPCFPADKVVVFRGGGAEGVPSARWGITANWRPAELAGTTRWIVELHPLSKTNRSTMAEVSAWEQEVVADPQLCAVLAGCNSAQSGGI